MESLKLIGIQQHMDYTNVNEKSEFQLNVGFWMGLPQVEVLLQLSSFIRGIHFYIVMMKLVNLFCWFLL
jgi:hypothetical protein